MAVKRKTKTEVKEAQKSKLSQWGESYTGLVLGLIVVIVVGILFFTFGRNKQTQDISSTQDGPVEEQQSEEAQMGEEYVVKQGDDLWSIAKNVYNDGYKWIEIAKANNLENPDIILSGSKISIPKIKENPVSPQGGLDAVASKGETSMSNAITGNSYTVEKGDTLWDISVRTYGDGYRWVEVARTNNLTNPDIIHAKNVLKLPR